MKTLRRLLLITLLVLFLSPVASYAKADEASMLEQARKHYQAKNYSFAYTWLERVLREYPATSRREEVLLMLSRAYASTGREDKAADTLRTLLKEYPKAGLTLDPDLAKLAGGAGVVAAEAKAAEAKAAQAIADKAKVAAENAAAAKAAEASAEKAAAAKAAAAKAAEAAQAKVAEKKAAEAALQAARAEAFLRKLAGEKAARMASATRVANAKQAEAVATEEKGAEVKDPEAAAKEAAAKAAKTKAAEAKAAKTKATEAKAAEAKAALALAAEAKEAERREAEARIAEQKVAEQMIAELKAAEQRNAEDRAAESAAEKAAEQRAAELEAGPALQHPSAKPAVSSAAVAGLPLVLVAPGMPADRPAPARDAGASVVPAPAVAPAGSLTENVTSAGKPGSSAKAVTYTLQIGEYVTLRATEEVKRKIKKAGLEPVVEQGAKRKEPMIRLSAGDYPTLEAAKKQLNKLREAKVDGFFLLGGDKRYHVYVGSYSDEKRAAEEGSRLAALGLGIKPSMKRVVVLVPTFKLTAGSFLTRAAALVMAEELEKQGVLSVPVERALPEKLP